MCWPYGVGNSGQSNLRLGQSVLSRPSPEWLNPFVFLPLLSLTALSLYKAIVRAGHLMMNRTFEWLRAPGISSSSHVTAAH